MKLISTMLFVCIMNGAPYKPEPFYSDSAYTAMEEVKKKKKKKKKKGSKGKKKKKGFFSKAFGSK